MTFTISRIEICHVAIGGAACLALFTGCGPAADPAASDPPSSDVSQDVTCNPTLTYYPVRGLHNNGYDSTADDSSQWTCDDAHSNSDYNTTQPHLGNDIWATEGTPVIATKSGTLTLTGFTPDSGNHVTLVDSCGWYHFSTHLQSIAPGIVDGKTISAGTVIGYVGNSGTLSNGVIHLHYSIYPDNNYDAGIDPWPYLHAVEHDVCNLPGSSPQATAMQLVALTDVGLYHTIRASAGTWSGFGNVLGQTGALAGITQIAEAGVGGDMQLVALTSDTIYHAIRTAAGTWTGWGNVEGQVGPLSGITGMAAAGVAGQLQVVAVANDTVYHAIRNAAGAWTAWGNVEGQVGALSHVTAIAAAEVSGELNLLAVANDTLYHAIRHANGTWTAWGSVEGQTGALTGITAVAAAGVSGQLQVVVATGNALNHTVRNAAGAWTAWGNVEGQTGAIPAVTSLSAASVSGQLQVIAIAGGTIYHAIRNTAGAWTGWGNVSSTVSGESGTPLRVAATGT